MSIERKFPNILWLIGIICCILSASVYLYIVITGFYEQTLLAMILLFIGLFVGGIGDYVYKLGD